MNYRNEDIRDFVFQKYCEKQDEAFITEDVYEIVDGFLTSVFELQHVDYYSENMEKSMVEKLILFAEDKGTRIITEDNKGGYYDSKKDKYVSVSSRWYDPLAGKYLSSGEIGTYKTYTEYDFFGDFLCVESGERWWTNETKPNPANTKKVQYYYKDEYSFNRSSLTDRIFESDNYFWGQDDHFAFFTYDDSKLFLTIDKGTLEYNRQ